MGVAVRPTEGYDIRRYAQPVTVRNLAEHIALTVINKVAPC